MKCQFSRHAREEMTRRRIPLEWIDLLLDTPEQHFEEAPGKEVLQSRVEAENGKIYLLRAIVATDKIPPVLVTVYRTSKVEKDWRPK